MTKSAIHKFNDTHYAVFCDCGDYDHTLDLYITDDGDVEIISNYTDDRNIVRRVWNAITGKYRCGDTFLTNAQAKELANILEGI